MLNFQLTTVAMAGVIALTLPASAGEKLTDRVENWISGDWYLLLGTTGMVAPDFEGAKDYMLRASPIVSLGKVGPEARFSSRNDNISISLFDTGAVRAGLAGRVVFPRDDDIDEDIEGTDSVSWGAEVGGFVEVYPTDWLRVRGEVRQGIAAHDGIVADISADAFYDLTQTIRVSAGPRLTMASSGYFDAYYGVDSEEADESGLSEYHPGGGLKSAGAGGAINWKMTDNVTTTLFGEYARLLGPAADSSIVRERGSEDQFTVGISATYRFGFRL